VVHYILTLLFFSLLPVGAVPALKAFAVFVGWVMKKKDVEELIF